MTYSDEGQGHTGYVYRCSGWTPTDRNKAKTLTDAGGKRVSRYRNGDKRDTADLVEAETWIQRWEHWICGRADVIGHFDAHWAREPIPGKVWRSGNQAFTYVRRPSTAPTCAPMVGTLSA